jgi:hypothetical protein
MKINKIYTLLAVAVAALTTTACFDDPGTETLFTGNIVEFNAANIPNGITSSFVRLNNTQSDVVEVQVNRVSTTATEPITINIAADPTSTAVEGVHYSLASKTVVINAGEFVAKFPVKVLTGNISPSETPNLVLKMASATGAAVSSNYGGLTVRIRVICPSTLAAKYTVFWEKLQLGNGTGGAAQSTTNFVIAAAKEVTFTASGTGSYLVDDISFGMYPGLYQDSKPGGRINDACRKLTGPATNADRYGDKFTINGDVQADGTLKIVWSNTYGDGGTVILTKI